MFMSVEVDRWMRVWIKLQWAVGTLSSIL